jgi:chemotaxis signal transduction protein
MPESDSVSSVRPAGVLELLVFEVAGEEFAVETGAVCEVRAPSPAGGRAGDVPVIDLRQRLGLRPSIGEQRLVVVEDSGGAVGLLVDRICEVLRLSEEMVDPASAEAGRRQARFVRGAVTLDERRLLVLSTQDLVAEGAGATGAGGSAGREDGGRGQAGPLAA